MLTFAPDANEAVPLAGWPTLRGLRMVGDGDSFTFDPNTGRMATNRFSLNGALDQGKLTWNSNGLPNRHAFWFIAAVLAYADWLGTTRFSSTPSRTLTTDWAVAPYGEHYATTGPGPNAINLFTGTPQEIAVDLYDTQFREYHSTQGRWISPDPAGIAAANPADPQSWNRYAYVGNRPLNATDPTGLEIICCSGGGDGGGGGYCPPEYENCDPGCDPVLGRGGGPGGPPPGYPPPPGNPPGNPPPPQRTGGVWPGNQTPGLPGGLNQSPLSLSDLLGFTPGWPGLGCEFGNVCDPVLYAATFW